MASKKKETRRQYFVTMIVTDEPNQKVETFFNKADLKGELKRLGGLGSRLAAQLSISRISITKKL